MTDTLYFPGLGWEIELNRVAVTIFGRPIYWYGVMFALAFLLGVIYLLYRYKLFGLDDDRMIDVLLVASLCGVVGARLYYVAFTWGPTYTQDPLKIFRVWEGGIAMYGSIIGAVLGILLMCKIRGVKLLPLLDLFSTALILGQAVGRWGNFFNIEAFGSNTDLPWGMTSNRIVEYLTRNRAALEAVGMQVDPAAPVHPTFFYESVWCLLGFALLAWYTSRRRFDGELTLIYFGWYGLGRAFIEGLRTDSLMAGTVRVSQVLAVLCVIASAAALAYIHHKIRKADDPDYRMLYVNTPEGQAVLAGTFYQQKDRQPAPIAAAPRRVRFSRGSVRAVAPVSAQTGPRMRARRVGRYRVRRVRCGGKR